MPAQTVAMCRDRIRDAVHDYNRGHPQSPVPPLHLKIIRARNGAPTLRTAPDCGVSEAEWTKLSAEERCKVAQPHQQRVFAHQDWAPFQRYVATLRAAALVAVLLSNLLWSASASAGLCDGWGRQFIYDAYSVQRCLTEGRRAEAQNVRTGETPLMGAAMIGDTAAVQFLLEAGARTTTTDKTGMTALDWAKRFNRRAAVTLLQQAVRR